MPSASLQVMSLLVRIARRVGTDLDREFADLGLTSQQAAVLLNVHVGHTTPQALSRVLAIDAGGMTRLVDRLVDRGLVDRVPSTTDRRVVTIVLTERGRTIAPGLPERYETVARRLTRPLEGDDLANLLSWLGPLAPSAGPSVDSAQARRGIQHHDSEESSP